MNAGGKMEAINQFLGLQMNTSNNQKIIGIKSKHSKSETSWHQPIIPGLEEFMSQFNQQPETTGQPQSK
jgi:hypothetical protein